MGTHAINPGTPAFLNIRIKPIDTSTYMPMAKSNITRKDAIINAIIPPAPSARAASAASVVAGSYIVVSYIICLC